MKNNIYTTATVIGILILSTTALFSNASAEDKQVKHTISTLQLIANYPKHL